MKERIEEFYQDKAGYRGPYTHIEEKISDPVLQKIDDVYVSADSLSIQNAEKYRRILLALSVAGTLLAIAFLLYDEVYWYGMVLACGVLLLVLFLISRTARRLNCHRKYLEYRLLAEGARVQYFLYKAGIGKNAAELLPWPWQFNVPWTKTLLEEIARESGESRPPGQSVLDIWIRDQKDYHEKALARTEAGISRDNRIARTALLLAVLTYAAALVFEITAGGLFSGRVLLSANHMELIRVILKVSMGSFSAMTLFTGSYYGKLSLEDTAQDHRRMTALYGKTETEILENGETEELLIHLAREELSENSNWYAYQSKNRPDIQI